MKIDITSDKLIPLVASKENPGAISVEKITGKNPKTILRWTKGGLVSVKIGGTWYTTKECLEAFSVHSVGKVKSSSRTHDRSMRLLSARIGSKRGHLHKASS